MSDLESKAVDILNKMEALTTQYAPDVTEAAFMAVRVSGIGDLISCFAGLLFSSLAIYFAIRFNAFCLKKKESAGHYSDWDVAGGITLVCVGVTGGMIILVASISMFDIWMWTAIFNPELAMAHKILGL
jgi:hypothetical protein